MLDANICVVFSLVWYIFYWASSIFSGYFPHLNLVAETEFAKCSLQLLAVKSNWITDYENKVANCCKAWRVKPIYFVWHVSIYYLNVYKCAHLDTLRTFSYCNMSWVCIPHPERACQQTPMNPRLTLFLHSQDWQLIPLKTSRIAERGKGCVAGEHGKLQMIDSYLFCLLNTT